MPFVTNDLVQANKLVGDKKVIAITLLLTLTLAARIPYSLWVIIKMVGMWQTFSDKYT